MASVKNFISSFAARLNEVDPSLTSGSGYPARYLGHLLDHRHYYLEIYAAVLDRALQHSIKLKEEITLIDFGAGNGLLGMFAKHCGFRDVYINDMDKTFVEAAATLASQLDINISKYIHGDLSSLSHEADIIVGTDVIEHVYNLDTFFDTLRKANPQVITVFTTASNPANYFKVGQLKKLQQRDELVGGDPDDFLLFGESGHEPFLKIREKIIAAEAPMLSMQQHKELAGATRGYDRNDIITAVQEFTRSGKLPQPPSHPTNTVNPLNSSWTERILTFKEYKDIYKRNGFSLEIFPGFYDCHKGGMKRYLNMILNGWVKILRKSVAPFIILVGYPGEKFRG